MRNVSGKQQSNSIVQERGLSLRRLLILGVLSLNQLSHRCFVRCLRTCLFQVCQRHRTRSRQLSLSPRSFQAGSWSLVCKRKISPPEAKADVEKSSDYDWRLCERLAKNDWLTPERDKAIVKLHVIKPYIGYSRISLLQGQSSRWNC